MYQINPQDELLVLQTLFTNSEYTKQNTIGVLDTISNTEFTQQKILLGKSSNVEYCLKNHVMTFRRVNLVE